MRQEAEEHADEDLHRKELIEARNNADTTAYSAEKVLSDLGDKVPSDLKGQVEAGVAKVREAMNGEEVETLRKETENLSQILQQVGAAAYQQAGPETGPGPGAEADPGEGEGEDPSDEDVIDGEFA
jgi:molecular chaperone DnaK